MAKYGPDGALLWATRAGGSDGIDQGAGIATTARGDSYVTGVFRGTATFGEGEPNETTLTSAGQRRYLRGQVRPRRRAAVGHSGRRRHRSDGGLGIATTARGDSYVTGFFPGTATFGEGEPNETTLTSAGNEDIFVAKYDPDGALRVGHPGRRRHQQ